MPLTEVAAFLAALSPFGAWAVVVFVLVWQQNLINQLLEHQRKILDKLLGVTENASNSTRELPTGNGLGLPNDTSS